MACVATDVMITSDKDDFVRYEHNFAHRKIALLVLGTGNWQNIRNHMSEIAAQIEIATPEKFILIDMPLPPKHQYPRTAD